jgi:hypothetical protein
MDSSDGSDKSRAIALALGCVLGVFGAHRFYLGKIGTGILQVLTMGGMGVWWLYDMILLASGSFRDAEGHRVKHWFEDEASGDSGGGQRRLSGEVLQELDALREEVAELVERVDFTERLLTRSRNDLGYQDSSYEERRPTPL